MSGYAASARLRGGSTRLRPVTGSADANAPGPLAARPPTRLDLAPSGWIELAGQLFGERLAARWDDLREAWSQMTFFLFDPESWR